MIGAGVSFDTRARREMEKEFSRQLEKAAINMTLRAADKSKSEIRAAMAAAGLGRLGQGIGHGHGGDTEKAGQVHRRAGGGWSASGSVFVRSGSRRTRGAIISYTELAGTEITPKTGRWLWFPTPDLKRTVGLPVDGSGGPKKARLTPGNWDVTYGRRFGPLATIKSVNGHPIMILKNPAGVSASGKRGLSTLTKAGKPRKGQVVKDFIVAFIAIPRTSRQARIDVPDIINKVIAGLPEKAGLRFEAG